MAPRAGNNPRQWFSRACGCPRCIKKFPTPERRPRTSCIAPWQARYRDPSGKQRSKCFDRKKDAEAFLDSVRTRIRARDYSDPKRGQITLSEWWDMWWPAQPKQAVTTTNRKLSAWNAHVEPNWGTWKLADLEYLELQAWLTSCVKGYHARKKVLELLNAMLRDAVRDNKRIPFNPAAEVVVEAPPKKHADDLRPPTREQVELIRQHLPRYYQPLVTFLAETGLRWGEATGLRWGHIDLEAKHLKVKEVLSDDRGKLFRKAAPKTTAGFRTVPLTPEAIGAVQKMVARWRPSQTVTPIRDPYDLAPEELVFRGPQGGVLTRHNFRRTWVPAVHAAGLAREVKNPETGRMELWPRVHDLRHVFATWLKDLGIDEKDTQTILGHDRGSKVTWIYQHSPEDVAARVRARLAPEAAGIRTLKAV